VSSISFQFLLSTEILMSKREAGKKGGRARAEILAPERRSEIAREAAMTRWADQGKPQPVLAKYGGVDRPLRIGEIEIPCYVLADGTRVLAQRGLQGGIGLSLGGGKTGARRIAELMNSLLEKGIDVRGLVARANSPIRFIPPHGGNPADGYEATILPDICAVLIDAHQQGKLGKHREHLARRAAILQHGWATIGIIGLVDEATGYQRHRARDALAKILEEFIAKELRPYVRTFPDEFYDNLFRLRGMEYPRDTVQRPRYFGHLTNDIIYARLAPGVLEELRNVTPRREDGRLKHTFTRRLTEDVGHPKLREHLASVVTIMRLSSDYEDFMLKLDRIHPPYGKTMPLALQDKRGTPL
jgi:hypothetical protein